MSPTELDVNNLLTLAKDTYLAFSQDGQWTGVSTHGGKSGFVGASGSTATPITWWNCDSPHHLNDCREPHNEELNKLNQKKFNRSKEKSSAYKSKGAGPSKDGKSHLNGILQPRTKTVSVSSTPRLCFGMGSIGSQLMTLLPLNLLLFLPPLLPLHLPFQPLLLPHHPAFSPLVC